MLCSIVVSMFTLGLSLPSHIGEPCFNSCVNPAVGSDDTSFDTKIWRTLPLKLPSMINPMPLNLLRAFAKRDSVVPIISAKYALLAKQFPAKQSISAIRHFSNHVKSCRLHRLARIHTPLNSFFNSFIINGADPPRSARPLK